MILSLFRFTVYESVWWGNLAERCKKNFLWMQSDVWLICVLPNLYTKKEISVRSALDGSCIVLSALPNDSGLSCWVCFGFCIHSCVNVVKAEWPFFPKWNQNILIDFPAMPTAEEFPSCNYWPFSHDEKIRIWNVRGELRMRNWFQIQVV